MFQGMLCLDNSTNNDIDNVYNYLYILYISWNFMIYVMMKSTLQNYHSNNIHNSNSLEL